MAIIDVALRQGGLRGNLFTEIIFENNSSGRIADTRFPKPAAPITKMAAKAALDSAEQGLV